MYGIHTVVSSNPSGVFAGAFFHAGMSFKRLNRAAPAGSELGDAGESFGFSLTRAWMRFHDNYAARLDRLGLTPNRVLALAYVVHKPGADQSSLGRALGINRASAMSLIDKLEAGGLVQRGAGADRRSNALSATAPGVRAYREAMEHERRVELELLEGISEVELNELRAHLDLIASRLPSPKRPAS